MRDSEVLERARKIAPRRYEPKRVLGTGAMGHVVCAWDAQLQRDVALKLIVDRGPAAKEAQRRFMREARALAALDDDRLVRIYDVDADRGLLVLEFVEGASLRTMINARRTIGVAEARQIAIDVLALAILRDAVAVNGQQTDPRFEMVDVLATSSWWARS